MQLSASSSLDVIQMTFAEWLSTFAEIQIAMGFAQFVLLCLILGAVLVRFLVDRM